MNLLSRLPFRGIIALRPYPSTGLTTDLWRKLPLRTIHFDNLWLTQEKIDIATMFDTRSRPGSDTFPHVVRYAGHFYLEDGHHRVVRLALSGQWSTYVRLYHIDNSDVIKGQ